MSIFTPTSHAPTRTESSHPVARYSPWGSSSCKDRHNCIADTTGSTVVAAAAKLRLLPERHTVETKACTLSVGTWESMGTTVPRGQASSAEKRWSPCLYSKSRLLEDGASLPP